MYVVPEDLESVSHFLTGFTCAVMCDFPDLNYPNDLLLEIGGKRGWKKSAGGLIFHIGESDLSEDDKMNELIDIYIECYEDMFRSRGITDA